VHRCALHRIRETAAVCEKTSATIPLTENDFSAPAGIMAASRQFSGWNQPDLNFFLLNQLPGHDD
jgi:hypothetical protein